MKFMAIFLLLAAGAFATPPPGYTLAFDSDFSKPLSISNDGKGTTWCAHMPGGGDFGYAWFGVNPFASNTTPLHGGQLNMGTYYNLPPLSHWTTSFLSTVGTSKQGFAQALGYWECKAYWLGGFYTWPSFWLEGLGSIEPRSPYAEIDVFESYGEYPGSTNAAWHVWKSPGEQLSAGGESVHWNTTNTFHTFGCLIKSDVTTWYIDGYTVFTAPTTPEMSMPLFAVIDLAFREPDPATTVDPRAAMYVQYIRCYKPPTL